VFNGTQIPSMRENYTLVELGFVFQYFDKEYTKVSISSNGYVCLGENIDCGSNLRLANHDILVGFNCNLDATRRGSGQIYYKDLEPNSVAFKSSKIYLNLFNPEFEPTKVFIIIYDNVLASDDTGVSTSKVSFQIVLSSDSFKRSYVTFKYTSCPTDFSLRAPSGLNLKNDGVFEEVKIEDDQQCTGSNVGQAGVWVSEVTLKRYSKSNLGKLFN
jgi:hypothetical protein